MTQPLEDYYERELAVFGDLMRDFAGTYPAEAGRLIPDLDRPPDPHLDRMIQGFALLTGRLHHKLDSEFPELSEALLQVMYPHLLAPVPAMSVAQFGPSNQARNITAGSAFPRHTALQSQPVGPDEKHLMPCRWRTGHAVTVWPIQVTSAQVLRSYFPAGLRAPARTVAALVMQLECLGAWKFTDLPLDKLRFYLNGDRQVIAHLYEVLFNHTLQVAFRSAEPLGKRDVVIISPTDCLHQVGFEPEEGLLPLTPESFAGYRLLTEFLSFREKFLFLDVGGWRQANKAGLGRKTEVVFFLNRAEENLDQGVTARTFQLGCAPIINLFEKSAEPLAVTQKVTEYRVVPSRPYPMGMEIYSVNSVTAYDPARSQTFDFQPFYHYGPGFDSAEHAFWHGIRRDSEIEGDSGTEIYLTLVDAGFDARQPAEAVLHIMTTCSNRDWPRFQRAGGPLYLEAKEGAAAGPIVCLHLPTAPLRPPLRRGTYWRLLSQNNLHHLSLTDPKMGRQALQEMLRLCDFSDGRVVPQLAAVNQKVIEGISSLTTRPVLGRISRGTQIGSCPGHELTLELDERQYVGVGQFLFSCVLERFLGLYAGVNSFSQLVAKTKQAEGYFKKWPPRAANRQLR